MKNTRRKLEIPMPAAMPCKTSLCLSSGETCGTVGEHKTKHACIVEADKSMRIRMEGALYSYHEDHIAAGTGTCPLLYKPIQFCRADIREDANTHNVISCKYLQIVSARQSKNSASLTFAFDFSFFLDVLLPRVIDGSQGGEAFGVGFGARSLLSCGKLHWSPFEHWPVSFHW